MEVKCGIQWMVDMNNQIRNFAMTGAAGFVAPRHLKAIRDCGHKLVAATDPSDSVGILDQYFFDVGYFREFERFDRHLEKLRRADESQRVHFLSVCSPNYLHDAHCRLGLRVGADVVCEKPLVINPWNLDALQELQAETERRIYTVLQLRVHPALVALRERMKLNPTKHEVSLTYVTSRGSWYDYSWKGEMEKSGGVVMNIGVHFFDLLGWLYGNVQENILFYRDARRVSGFLEFEQARVKWFLSIDHRDLPFAVVPGQRTTHRSITVDDQEVEFSEGFGDLHTRVYEQILGGKGFGIEDARASIELVHAINRAELSPLDQRAHSYLRR